MAGLFFGDNELYQTTILKMNTTTVLCKISKYQRNWMPISIKMNSFY